MLDASIRNDILLGADESARRVLSDPEYIRLRFRYINLNDTESELRREWIDQSLANYEILDFKTRPDILLSSARSDYDVVLVGGEDARRISDFMRDNINMMAMRPRICICAKSNPGRRAKLIMAGFDDVIDAQRTQPIEFIARMFAIWRRYQGHRHLLRQENEFRRLLNRVASVDRMPSKQILVLTCLLRSPGYCATYNALQIAASSDHVPISPTNLKVIISNLRKLLRRGFSIVSDRQSMYRLIMPDTQLKYHHEQDIQK